MCSVNAWRNDWIESFLSQCTKDLWVITRKLVNLGPINGLVQETHLRQLRPYWVIHLCCQRPHCLAETYNPTELFVLAFKKLFMRPLFWNVERLRNDWTSHKRIFFKTIGSVLWEKEPVDGASAFFPQPQQAEVSIGVTLCKLWVKQTNEQNTTTKCF